MRHHPLVWIGMGGIGPDDNPRALERQDRLHPVLVAVALLAVPAYLLGSVDGSPIWHDLGTALDAVIFVTFLVETVGLLLLTAHPFRYLAENWLNVVIIVAAGASLFGATSEWLAVVRVARLGLASLVFMRLATGLRILVSRRGASLLAGTAALILLGTGGLFYWLEPNIHSYWDGLWLAFVTGTTIGYGDLVPTAPAARVVAGFVAVIGVALMTLFTANVVTLFLHTREAEVNESLQRDIAALRSELAARAAVVDARDPRLSGEIAELKAEIAALKEALTREGRL